MLKSLSGKNVCTLRIYYLIIFTYFAPKILIKKRLEKYMRFAKVDKLKMQKNNQSAIHNKDMILNIK